MTGRFYDKDRCVRMTPEDKEELVMLRILAEKVGKLMFEAEMSKEEEGAVSLSTEQLEEIWDQWNEYQEFSIDRECLGEIQ